MYLKDNLYAIDGVLLAKKHQEITSDVIEGVRLAGKRHKRVETPLKNSAIFEDLRKFSRINDINLCSNPLFLRRMY